MHETGIYLFCFAQPAATVDGLDGVSVEMFESCSAVIAEVLLEDYTADHLAELAWLAPRACRHEAVVEAAMRHSAVLPVRFATVFSSLDSLRRFVAAHQDRIRTFLRETAGREEWGVKALVDSAEIERCAQTATLFDTQSGLASLQPGARYLRQKRIRNSADPPSLSPLENAASAFADDLSRLACALVARRPVSEPGRRVLKNWAFLVPKESADEFRLLANRAASQRAAPGLEFRISGPWPPYSFVPELAPVDLEELAHNGLARCGQVRRASPSVDAAPRGLCADE